jgi:FKBP-type peptidyl-prolyl cis-trans isomerase FkpA
MREQVVVHQRILNFDGCVIADTYKNGFTDRFTLKEAILKEAILELQEGLQWMTLGSRYKFVVPPDLTSKKRG